MGAWIAGSLFMIMVATQNFRSVDRLLANPAGAASAVNTLERDEARAFLRYQVSEQNRFYFETWEKIQLPAAALAVVLAWTGLREHRLYGLLTTAMLALLLVERFYLTPEIVRLGRLIDFVPPAAPSAERDAFWRLHGAYSGTELGKLALALILSGRAIFGR
jgi:hypothetical protein